MKEAVGTFRFIYLTDIFDETLAFYKDKLAFNMENSWDRSEDDKGALFHMGFGLIEIMKRPTDPKDFIKAFDYRSPQGVFASVLVANVDELYNEYKAKGVPFKQEIIDHPWGHRAFYVLEPNGLTLGFYEEIADAH